MQTEKDLAESRQTRIERVCKKKYPKLAAWKKDHGARTVLVLEENDIQLTNTHEVTQAILHAEEDLANKPDEIYLVTTCCDDAWWVSFVRVDDKSFFDFACPEERTWEINPIILEDLTKR